MNTRTQTDLWIYRLVVVLGLTAMLSAAGILTFIMAGWPVPKILLALGLVAGAGLVKLLISPLNRRLFE
jgi:hypothetical protein